MEGKTNSWNGLKITIDGVEIKHISSLNYEPKYTLKQLSDKLREAEENEEYELCAVLKNKIDNYKN